MKARLFLILLAGQFFFISCGTSKLSVKDFDSFSEPAVFNGTYLNKDNSLSYLFELYNETTNFITIEYNPVNSDTLKLSYYTEDGMKYSYFKGKKKKNYFEIYLHNTRIYFPAFTIVNIDRLRIGSNKESDLLVHNYDDHWGWILLLAGGGGANEHTKVFTKFDLSKCNFLIPHRENEKWGFIDSTQQFVISPEYDFVCLFDNGLAKIKLNGKWGLINEQGKKITPIKYDKIYSIDNKLIRVELDNKIGYVDITGREVFPPEYDELYLNTYDSHAVTRYKKDNKYGYVTNNSVLYPPVFDKAAGYFYCNVCFFQDTRNEKPYAKVKYNNESHIVDKEGYMYKYKCSWGKLTVFEDSKIKIQ